MIKIGEYKIEPTMFPDKTNQVWKLPKEFIESKMTVSIVWKFEDMSELITLSQLKLLLDHSGVSSTLMMPYIPFARQDKNVTNDTTFGLHAFARLLNSLGFQSISCYDPHSIASELLIQNLKPIYPFFDVKNTWHTTNADYVVYPDKGAANKYSQIYEFKYFAADKYRDQLTGQIIGVKLDDADAPKIKDKNLLIIDDICDGGKTFIVLSKLLYNMGAKEINLFVTHGIFSNGTEVLFNAGIKRIFTMKGELERAKQ